MNTSNTSQPPRMIHALCATLMATASAIAHGPPTDCDANGVNDVLQWGQNYVCWDGTPGSGTESLNDPLAWCSNQAGGPDSLDRMVFWSSQTAYYAQLDANLAAWSLKVTPTGNVELRSDNLGRVLSLNSQAESPSEIDILGLFTLRCSMQQSGALATVRVESPNPLSGGMFWLLGTDFTTEGSIDVAMTGRALMELIGSTVSCRDLIVGNGGIAAGYGYQLHVDSQSTLAVSGSAEIGGEANIDGVLDGSLRGFTAVDAELGWIWGEGAVTGDLDGSSLVLEPRWGVFNVGGAYTMESVQTGRSGVLRIDVPSGKAGAPVVPQVHAHSVSLDGTLRVFVPSEQVAQLPPYSRIIASVLPLQGAFDCVQVTGVPENRYLRLIRPAGMQEIGIGISATPSTPDVAVGPTQAFLRVVTDAVLADFDGDGVQDAAMAMAADATGTSQVRFFKASSNTLTLMATIEVTGTAHDLAAFTESGGDGVAIALGAADTCAVLRGDGGWNFTVEYVETGPGTSPSGIAAGLFVNTSDPAAIEIAVGCVGTDQVKVFRSTQSGPFALAATIGGVRADSLRSGRFGGGITRDFLALNRFDPSATFATDIGTPAQAVRTFSLPARPTSATPLQLSGQQGTECIIISVDGASANPDSPVNNGLIFRLHNGEVDPVARLSLGDNPLSVSSADFDQDGDADLAAACTIGGLELIA